MSTPPDVDVKLLEPLLRELVALIGIEATFRLVECYGGTLLSIPHAADENRKLVELLGPENAARLGQAYGGERPLIPKALRALQALRDARIRAELEHKSVRTVARENGLGERRVWQIKRAGPPAPPPPLPLFE